MLNTGTKGLTSPPHQQRFIKVLSRVLVFCLVDNEKTMEVFEHLECRTRPKGVPPEIKCWPDGAVPKGESKLWNVTKEFVVWEVAIVEKKRKRARR